MIFGKFFKNKLKRFSQKSSMVTSGKRIIFYFSPNLPDYDTSSGGKRATRILKLLKENFDVYVFTKGLKHPRHLAYLKSHGIVVAETSYNFRLPKVDFIIFAWYNSFYEHKGILRKYPNAKVLVDTVDVHWVRELRLLGIHPEYNPSKIKSNRNKEIKVYKKADIIFAVTENDRQEILKVLPKKRVAIISNIHEVESNIYQDSLSYKILFFGGFYHFPNIGAAQYLAKVLMPKVKKIVPNAELIIAGSNAPRDIVDLGSLPGVNYLGYVEEKQLPELYRSIAISVVPLFAGSGIKGKICESIAFRRPVITNKVGNEGIELIHEVEGLICENEEMVPYIIKALNREYDFELMTEKAWKKIEPIVGKSTVKNELFKLLS